MSNSQTCEHRLSEAAQAASARLGQGHAIPAPTFSPAASFSARPHEQFLHAFLDVLQSDADTAFAEPNKPTAYWFVMQGRMKDLLGQSQWHSQWELITPQLTA